METTVYVVLASGFIAIITYCIKEIVKPWSDAALNSSRAFSLHVKMIDEYMPKFLEEYRKSTDLATKTMAFAEASKDELKKQTAAISNLKKSADDH